jgi:hypothetical protein
MTRFAPHRWLFALLAGLTLAGSLGACVVYDRGRCPDGWVPEHRDFRGRWIRGHCR